MSCPLFSLAISNRALEELTILSRSLRNQYNNLDEVIDLAGTQIRRKATLTTDQAAKKSTKSSRKGKKVRIAPTMDESTRGEEKSGTRSGDVGAGEGVEMVELENRSEERTSPTPLSPTGESDHLLTDSNDYVHNALHSTETDDSPVPEGADGDGDTQALLGPASTGRVGGGIDARGMVTAAPKRVIIADALRFLFLGLPG